MKIGSISETKKHLCTEVVLMYRWECPNCSQEFEDEAESKAKFIDSLIKDVGIRYVRMKHMQGLLCPTCFNDPEVQESTL